MDGLTYSVDKAEGPGCRAMHVRIKKLVVAEQTTVPPSDARYHLAPDFSHTKWRKSLISNDDSATTILIIGSCYTHNPFHYIYTQPFQFHYRHNPSPKVASQALKVT